jgi:hypothetical protein
MSWQVATMPAGENAEAETRQKVIVELPTQAPMSGLWCERRKKQTNCS